MVMNQEEEDIILLNDDHNDHPEYQLELGPEIRKPQTAFGPSNEKPLEEFNQPLDAVADLRRSIEKHSGAL